MGAGPILIFDKSALQGLSVDESVMLDTFFLANMTPIFFIEALADLEKPDSRGRTPEQAVMKDLAAKVPDRPHPNVFHQELLEQDLFGYPVAMTGQVIVSGGTLKRDERGGVSVVVEEPPEVEMVHRWQVGDFAEAERRFARAWRGALLNVNFRKKIDASKYLLRPRESVADLTSVKVVVDKFLRRSDREAVAFAAKFLGVSDEGVAALDRRHESSGRPSIDEFAPYAAFVLSVDLVFYLAMATGIITSQKKSNLVDLSYLYYLPFCMVFTSRDRLHEQLAPMFLRPRQRFVWADDLKSALKSLDEHYAPRRAEIGRIGLIRVHEPPPEVRTVVSELWETCLRLDGAERDDDGAAEAPVDKRTPSGSASDEDNQALLERINRIIVDKGTLPQDASMEQPDSVITQSRVSVRRRGSWDFYPPSEEDGSGSGSSG